MPFLAVAARCAWLCVSLITCSSVVAACGSVAVVPVVEAGPVENPLATDSLVAQSDANCVWLNDCNAAAYPNVAQCSLTLQEVKTKDNPIAEGAKSACTKSQIDQCVKDIKASRCPAAGLAAAGSLPNPTSCDGC